MFLFKKPFVLTAVLLLMLAGCGGDGVSSKVDRCVVGFSEIGDCKVFNAE